MTFVDTNVLLYAHDNKPDSRYKIAKELVGRLWDSQSGVVSTQVLQEFYFNATKVYKLAMSRAEARRALASYARWRVIPTDAQMIMSASRLEEEHSVSFWDALIVEAALRASAAFLVSEDLQDGRKFGSLTVRNPFA
ncbi:MAG TPA: PIN domain-containing protein [Pseudonocardiaceae bacterium]